MEKHNKVFSKMYENLVQWIVHQKVQQKMHNNYDTLLIMQSVFTKLVECLC